METWLLQSQCIIQQKLESRFAGWFVFQFFAGWEKNVRLPAVFGKFPQAKSLQIRVPPSTNLRRVLKKHANNSRKRIGSSGIVQGRGGGNSRLHLHYFPEFVRNCRLLSLLFFEKWTVIGANRGRKRGKEGGRAMVGRSIIPQEQRENI